MPRSVNQEWIDASISTYSKPRILVSLAFGTGFIRLWNGDGEVTINSNVYYGNGWLKEIATPSENYQEDYDDRIVVVLQGQSQDVLSLITLDTRINYSCDVSLVYELDDGGYTNEYKIFRGFFSHSEIIDNPTLCTVQLFYYPDYLISHKVDDFQYTQQVQKVFYPDDRGFEFVETLSKQTLWWGNDQNDVQQILKEKEKQERLRDKKRQERKDKRENKRRKRKNRII